jgi:DNA polymerase-1
MALAKKKRLYLIDGMSQIYRAYYAIRGLSTSTGVPTNAIYGFTMMLRRLLTAEKPDYIGVVLDTAGPTFRHESFEKYKSSRTAMPDDLSVQMRYITRVCDALRIPITSRGGFEADDLIGTFTKEAEKLGLEVVIVTNDKDLCQLVDDSVTVMRTDRMGNTVVMDPKAVVEKFGVRPDQIVDLLALMGDTIDDIPGAPGVGEKGAKQLVEQFGSIENALANADQITRKTYRESLKNNADLIRQSYELATIKCDVPVTLDLEALKYGEADRTAAYQLFLELEFSQLVKEYADAKPREESSPARALTGRTYRRITTQSELEGFIASLWPKDRIAIAPAYTEAFKDAGKDADKDSTVYGIAISPAPGESTLIDLRHFEAGATPLASIKEVLENGLVRKAVHDWKTCLHVFDRYAREHDPASAPARLADGRICEIEPAIRIDGVADDTMLAAYLVDPNRSNYRYREVAREHLGVDLPAECCGFEGPDLGALQAADLTYELATVLRERIETLGLEPVYQDIELPLVEILFEMEQLGVRIDTDQLAAAGVEMERELARLTSEIFTLAGQEFNINSTVQLGEIFEKLNFETGRKTKTGRISTSFDVLEELAAKYELPRLIIEYRELAKLKNTYVDALPKLIDPKTGRIHTTLNQAVAATGRLSSTNPNLQNIPIRSEMGRRIRAAFVAAPGHVLLSADYSQIELRIFAHITGDPVMTDAFKMGEDIHARTARAVFGAKSKEEEHRHRRVAKIVNFAIAYDIGPFGLAQRTGLSRAEAKAAIQSYYQTYTGVRRYMEETPTQVRQTGIVRTIFGRIRPIPDIANRNHNLRARAEREAINAPIQGTAADLVKIAMIKVHKRLRREKLGAKMILQVHDELLLEVPQGEVERTGEIVKQEMESVHEMAVPLLVDVGTGHTWMEAKP